MLKRLLTALTAVVAVALAAPAGAQDLNAVLTDAMKDSQVPAMGMLIIRDGKVSGEAQRGLRRIGGNPVQAGDVWHIGSDGKAMTATMVSRLVDKGVLHWETPLDQMLPELAADMRPEYRKVTLLQLMSHHAGLPHDYHDEKALA